MSSSPEEVVAQFDTAKKLVEDVIVRLVREFGGRRASDMNAP